MTKLVRHLKNNLVGWAALFIALGGTGYAAVSLPARSVGNRQLKAHSITASKLNPTSVAASVRAWANLTWASGWHVQASSSDIHVTTTALGEVVTWRHTRFASNCMASVTPQRNFGPGGPGGSGTLDGRVSTFFDPRAGNLQIDALADDGTRQAQGVIILIVCPSQGSQKVSH
jgi:hypothetical protein